MTKHHVLCDQLQYTLCTIMVCVSCASVQIPSVLEMDQLFDSTEGAPSFHKSLFTLVPLSVYTPFTGQGHTCACMS